MKQYTVTLTLPNGKRKYFRGATKKEAEKKRDAARIELERGLDIGSDITVNDLAKLWLAEYKEGNVRDCSYLNIESMLRNHILPEIGRVKVREVKPIHIQRVLNSMKDNARSTQRRVLAVAKEMFGMAVDNDLLLKNPCSKSIRPNGDEADEKVPLTPEQSDRLLDKARGTCMYLFVLLGLNAGLRRGELLGLQWQDIDFERGTLSVSRSIAPTRAKRNGELNPDLKTPAARRTIPLPWPVVEELRKEKSKSRSIYVIHGPDNDYMKLSNSSYHWGRLVDGLPFEANPHLMRHTRITRWFDQGLDIKEVQYLAGHATSKMTLDVYTHYQKETRFQDTLGKIQAAT